MRHLQYLRYLIAHKFWVLVAGFRLPLRMTPSRLWRLISHDWTKFLPSEWGPYVETFYGTIPKNSPGAAELSQLRYDRAWNHHQKTNDHHWQYWVLIFDDGTERLVDPPVDAVWEMVCDWAGAGRAIHGSWDVAVWYVESRELIRLHPNAKDLAEKLLESFGLLVFERAERKLR